MAYAERAWFHLQIIDREVPMKRLRLFSLLICVFLLISACPNGTGVIDQNGDNGPTNGSDHLETVAAPTIDPGSDEYNTTFEVTIACATDGAAIYYTTDGSNPSASSTLYEAPISIYADTDIKAIAAKDGMNDSSVVQATYTLNPFVAGRIAVYFKVQLSYSTDGMWVGGSWVSWSDSEHAI